MSRPDITLAMDVRSYERVVLIAPPGSSGYPEDWEVSSNPHQAAVDGESVVLVDGTDLTWREFLHLAAGCPRLFGFAVPRGDREFERRTRRMISSHFPWAEVWTVWSDLGKLLVARLPYDRKAEA